MSRRQRTGLSTGPEVTGDPPPYPLCPQLQETFVEVLLLVILMANYCFPLQNLGLLVMSPMMEKWSPATSPNGPYKPSWPHGSVNDFGQLRKQSCRMNKKALGGAHGTCWRNEGVILMGSGRARWDEMGEQ